MTPKRALRDIFQKGEDKVGFESSLIELVEPVRYVWDLSEADHKNKTKIQNAFVKIADQLGKSGLITNLFFKISYQKPFCMYAMNYPENVCPCKL